MDALKAQFERIKQQLSALSATQKMLVASLVGIMVLTMMFWGKYAGDPEMVPVIDKALTEDEIGPIDRLLVSEGVTHTVVSGKVMVPADKQQQAFADLMFAEVLPQDTHSAFETMNKQLSPLSMFSERDAAYNQAVQMELAQSIGRWKGIASVKVLINPKLERHFGGDVDPTATVDIRTKGEAENPKQIVRAAAEGVSGAVSGLMPSKVSVIINGIAMRLPDAATDPLGTTSDYMDLKATEENRIAERIKYVLAIPGVTAVVNCDMENRTIQDTTIKYDKEKPLSLPSQTHEHTEDTSGTSGGSHEPGNISNNGAANGSMDVGGGGGGSGAETNTTSIHDETVSNNNFVGSSTTHTDTPAGKGIPVSATVGVPQSYYFKVYKRDHPTVKDNADAGFTAFMTDQLALVKKSVQNVANIKSDDEVTVSTFMDPPDDLLLTTDSGTGSTISTVGGHAKEIAIGVLAVVTLFMMASMVRKASPVQINMPSLAGFNGMTARDAEAALAHGGGSETVAGEARRSAGALDAVELNDEEVRAQQVLEQVSSMVKENPDGAANLVKRWLSRA